MKADTFLYLYSLSTAFCELALCVFYQCRFLGAHDRAPVKMAVCVLLALVLSWVPSQSMQYLVQIAALVFLGTLRWHARPAAALFYGLVCTAVLQICFGVGNALLSLWAPVWYRLSPQAASAFTLIFVIVPLAASWACLAAVAKWFVPHSGVSAQTGTSALFLVPVLFLSMVAGYVNSNVYGPVGQIDAVTGMDVTSVPNGAILMLEGGAFASLFCVLAACAGFARKAAQAARAASLEEQTRYLSRYIQDAAGRYAATRSFRHDLANHMLVLRGLVSEGKETEAIGYMDSIGTLSQSMREPANTGCPAADVLIGDKLAAAHERGMDAQCLLSLPADRFVDDLDLCVVLSNALDNAIEGAAKSGAKRPWLRVSGRSEGDFLMLEVANSCSPGLAFREGTGLGNIRSAAGRYGGAVQAGIKNGVFTLAVLFVHPRQS